MDLAEGGEGIRAGRDAVPKPCREDLSSAVGVAPTARNKEVPAKKVE